MELLHRPQELPYLRRGWQGATHERMVDIMTNTVKLQGIYGEQKGTATKDLKVGDVIVWNFGYKSEVVEIIPSKTGKTITFMLRSLESGNVNPRKMGADRLVVIEEKAIRNR